MFTFLKTIVANTKEYFGESLQETFVKDDFPIHMKAEFLKMILSLGGLLLALTLGI